MTTGKPTIAMYKTLIMMALLVAVSGAQPELERSVKRANQVEIQAAKDLENKAKRLGDSLGRLYKRATAATAPHVKAVRIKAEEAAPALLDAATEVRVAQAALLAKTLDKAAEIADASVVPEKGGDK